MTTVWSVLLDYVRMVSYAIVFLCSIFGFKRTTVGKIILAGNALFALGALATVFVQNIFNIDVALSADYILTPVAIIWAIVNLYAFTKE